jgi:riboflavin synthase
MFSGLVEAVAPVVSLIDEAPGVRLTVRAPEMAGDAALGESVAVSGCCLTVVAARDGCLEFQAGPETLSRTTLGQLRSGQHVNLERSLRLSDRLGGHLVTGHVDGLGRLAERQDHGAWSTFTIQAPTLLMRQIAVQGSIAVEGVSLTVVDVAQDRFTVQLIPHTLAATTLGRLQPEDRLNLETDLLAKYVARQLAAGALTRP